MAQEYWNCMQKLAINIRHSVEGEVSCEKLLIEEIPTHHDLSQCLQWLLQTPVCGHFSVPLAGSISGG